MKPVKDTIFTHSTLMKPFIVDIITIIIITPILYVERGRFSNVFTFCKLWKLPLNLKSSAGFQSPLF